MKAHGVSALTDVPSFDREKCQRRRAAFDARLAALGYGAYEKNGYALVPPVSRMHPLGECLGVGLGALCRFDGYETRNTQDIRLYLDADGDFAKICASAKPI